MPTVTFNAITASIGPIKAELQQEISTFRQQIAAVVDTSTTQDRSVVNTAVEAAVQTKFCVVDETVRVGFEALDNRMTQCEFSLDALAEEMLLSECRPIRGGGGRGGTATQHN
jgi:hypothetical protein